MLLAELTEDSCQGSLVDLQISINVRNIHREDSTGLQQDIQEKDAESRRWDIKVLCMSMLLKVVAG